MNGNYEVNLWNGNSVAYFRKDAEDLFEVNGKSNVLVYVDEDSFENANGIDMYLAVGLAREFNVVISTDYNAEIAEKANIVINRFTSRNRSFLDDLARYDDGSRLFVSDDGVRNIRSRADFRGFVREMKSGLAGGTYVNDGNLVEVRVA